MFFLSTDNSAPNSTPGGNSLNLFDEILIEEGTAKEASYNEVCTNVTKIILVFWRFFVPNFLV